MEPFDGIRSLQNTYLALRHGHSLANEQRLIVSAPEKGTTGYGLSRQGATEVTVSVAKAMHADLIDSDTLIFSSDFLRAMESARIVQRMFGIEAVVPDVRLRERHFGDLEGSANSNYARVWVRDLADPNHRDHDVESAVATRARAVALVQECEERFLGRRILLVSHGDTLQLLQTAFKRLTAAQHRPPVIDHLNTGEIRLLTLAAPIGSAT